jgi:hypothetical protein
VNSRVVQIHGAREDTDRAAVGHREIISALKAGVCVVGGSSMGALRASELDSYGMIGVGRIYE